MLHGASPKKSAATASIVSSRRRGGEQGEGKVHAMRAVKVVEPSGDRDEEDGVQAPAIEREPARARASSLIERSAASPRT